MGGASLNPESYVEGVGLIDDVNVEFQDVKFVMWDYGGKMTEEVPALHAALVEIGPEGTAVSPPVEQYWSMGNARDWCPDETGKSLVTIGNATAINTSSNGAIFIKSLVEAGFPADKIGDDASVFNGLQAHVARIPGPKRPGLKDAARERTVLVVDSIIRLPWEKKVKAAAGKTTIAKKDTAAAPAATDPSDIETATTDFINEVLAEQGGSVEKKSLPTLLFKKASKDPNWSKIIKKAFDDAFLAAGPWEYKDGVISMGG